MHHLTILRQPRRLIVLPSRALTVAQMRPASGAVIAVTTENGQTGNDMIARHHIANLGADFLDNPSRLMPQHHWRRRRVEPFIKMHIAMANARRRRADDDLMRSGYTELDIFNRERLTHPAKYGCFHGVPSPLSNNPSIL